MMHKNNQLDLNLNPTHTTKKKEYNVEALVPLYIFILTISQYQAPISMHIYMFELAVPACTLHLSLSK